VKMLSIIRQIGQTIFIGNDIKITVLNLRNNRVKLGIEAPIEIPVYREEIYLKFQQQEEKQEEEKQEE